MSASTFAAVHIVPLLGRVVLCAAFVPAGYAKLFDHSEATPAEVARVDAIGWRWTPPPNEGTAGAGEVVSGGAKRDDKAAGAGEAAAGATDGDAAKQAAPASAPASASAPAAAPGDAAAAGAPRLRGCDKLALFIDAAGLPAPRITGWLVAIIELVGGALILVGLFSRLWGLGLAVVMVGAISMTSLAALKAHPFIYGMDMDASLKFLVQAGLFVLAFGVFLTGPGGASLDALLFGGRSASARPRAAKGGGGSQAP